MKDTKAKVKYTPSPMDKPEHLDHDEQSIVEKFTPLTGIDQEYFSIQTEDL